ncbi:hypothetical protein TOPH_04048 [Tolypocladium ophioglossoides CBS 100239]|uniref:Uncharacterized protein n=1 Tax=Tolypocladium ophioglossoides (strain CBS 100239) TaxID=1163406 RepID=A0A0L0NBA5_TOLOC|nr:hypothetical protein TOPH_04048 [Tolypocladium ophioglossoides CBS 100239]
MNPTMATAKTPSPDAITKEEFDDLLSQYPAVVETISQSKGAKPGRKTLQELDQYRYVDALDMFGSDKSQREMTLDHVKLLVEWKLRHGKFRPTLMSLVTSNPQPLTKSTIQAALHTYRTTANIPSTLDALTKLRGIGPATASLLLAVHDPTRVIFFSDEAFYWLCCGGGKAPIKYTAKEYQSLRDRAGELTKRLGVSATHVEKVAYVLMERPGAGAKSKAPAEEKAPKAVSKRGASSVKRKTVSSQDAAPRAPEDTAPKDVPGVRRSKRLKT